MKYAYEAVDSIEAHMILNMLEQVGIQGQVNGDYLQGGVGELPASGIVKVSVDEADYEQAREVIEQWESAQPIAVPATEPASNHSKISFSLSSAVVGIALGGILTWVANIPPTLSEGNDYNEDGIIDERNTFIGGRLALSEYDRNGDGAMDENYNYYRDGTLRSIRSDDDFNGLFETQYKYENGQLKSSESDWEFDGRVDVKRSYVNGILDTVEILNPTTSVLVKKQYFRANRIVSAEVDTDGDSILDTVYKYNRFEEIIGTTRK